jgi:hypothetical protein
LWFGLLLLFCRVGQCILHKRLNSWLLFVFGVLVVFELCCYVLCEELKLVLALYQVLFLQNPPHVIFVLVVVSAYPELELFSDVNLDINWHAGRPAKEQPEGSAAEVTDSAPAPVDFVFVMDGGFSASRLASCSCWRCLQPRCCVVVGRGQTAEGTIKPPLQRAEKVV